MDHSLSHATLFQKLSLKKDAQNDQHSRVKVRTCGGTQIGIPGVGEGDDRLTFPRRYLVADALEARIWFRFATEEEMKQDGKWYRISEVQPKAFVHSNGQIANKDDEMGLISTNLGNDFTLTSLESVPDPIPKKKEDLPLMDLEGISTPPTPRLCEYAWNE